MKGRQINVDQRQQIEGFLLCRPVSIGFTARGNCLFVDRFYWVLRGGAELRDLPQDKSTAKWNMAQYCTALATGFLAWGVIASQRIRRCAWLGG